MSLVILTHLIKQITVAISAISNSFEILNMLTTIHSFSSKQWMTQRPSVYELSSWHTTQLICVKCIKNSWMTISSVKSLSYYYSYQEQLSLFLVMTSESLLMSIVTFVYKPLDFKSLSQYPVVQQCDYIYQNKFFNVHMYICVCFIRNISNIQHGVRIEAVFASLQEGEHTDQIQQFPAYIQASWSFYKFYKIEFSTKKRREDIQGGIPGSSQSSSTVSSTVFPVFPHAIQGKDRIFILLQEDSSNSTRNTSTTRLIPCIQILGILQQLFPMHPSILHGKIRLQAPYCTPRFPAILPTETAF